MAESKLDVLRRLLAQREKAAGRALQQLRAERDAQEAQARSLGGMLAQYGNDEAQQAATDADSQLRLRRFYARVAATRDAQEVHVERLKEQEQDGATRWESAYRLRKAVDKLNAERAATARRLEVRKARRADGSRRSSMLKGNTFANSDLENH